jgi:hypothetical protein
MARIGDQEGFVMADRQKIKAFAQDVLGCGCAEEVSKIIDLRQETMAGPLFDRINIGNRLLVYIFRTDDPEFVKKELPGIVRAGVEERDRNGFNRFRLVLAADEARVEIAAMKAYKGLGGTDDCTFLHVVEKDQVASYRCTAAARGAPGRECQFMAPFVPIYEMNERYIFIVVCSYSYCGFFNLQE